MNNTASEIVFLIGEEPEVGYTARALGESIFTQADDMASLKESGIIVLVFWNIAVIK